MSVAHCHAAITVVQVRKREREKEKRENCWEIGGKRGLRTGRTDGREEQLEAGNKESG